MRAAKLLRYGNLNEMIFVCSLGLAGCTGEDPVGSGGTDGRGPTTTGDTAVSSGGVGNAGGTMPGTGGIMPEIGGNDPASTGGSSGGNDPASTGGSSGGNDPANTGGSSGGNDPASTGGSSGGNDPAGTGGSSGGNDPASTGGSSGGNDSASAGGSSGGNDSTGGEAIGGAEPGVGGSGAGPSGETSTGCGTAPSLESGTRSITVSGSMREYILRIPDDYDMNQPYRLIFGFHARGGNAGQVAGGSNNDYYGLFTRSDGSAIFVSPDGIDAGWRNTDGRDVDLVRAILDELGADLCIDHSRIFSAGFSFGGMMSDAIGCAMADVFRAIAPMAGAVQNAEHLYSECNQVNDHPVAVWMAHGDNDTVVPLSDGLQALDIFLERAECGSETLPVEPSPCVAYQGCLPDYPIHLCQFSGGHQIPSFAADGIWAFFEQF